MLEIVEEKHSTSEIISDDTKYGFKTTLKTEEHVEKFSELAPTISDVENIDINSESMRHDDRFGFETISKAKDDMEYLLELPPTSSDVDLDAIDENLLWLL